MHGVVWNICALAFLGIAGIALNIIIGRWYGPATLGTFNIAFAIYILLSQVACFGLQLSALQAVSTADMKQPGALRQIILGGFWACGAIASVVTLLALAATPLFAWFFKSVSNLPEAWMFVAPGLLPFALNKYLLNIINGLQHMRAFSVFQALRFLFILVLLLVFAAMNMPGHALPGILSLAEIMLLLVVAPYVRRLLPSTGDRTPLFSAILRHLSFGARVLPAGMVAELNTRVDVLMLGFFLGDRAAGVYSVAALIYESALMAIVAVRNNINPVIGRSIASHEEDALLRLSRWIALGLTPLMLIGATLVYLGFPLMASVLFAGKDFDGTQEPLFWLMMSLPLSAAPLCFGLILSQGNRPGWQSLATCLVLLVNVIANALLIPIFGLAGAGMAMGLSGIMTGLLPLLLARRLLGVRLFF